MCEHVTWLDKRNVRNVTHEPKAGQHKAKENIIKARLIDMYMRTVESAPKPMITTIYSNMTVLLEDQRLKQLSLWL